MIERAGIGRPADKAGSTSRLPCAPPVLITRCFVEDEFDRSRWDRLCADERAQRLAWQAQSGSGDDPPPAASLLRAWWATVEQLLWAYVRGIEVYEVQIALPSDLAMMLATTSGFLAVGDIIEPVSGVATPGSLPSNPLRRDLLGWATAYLHMATSGEIADRSPNKTVREAFAVDRTTVQGWARLSVPPTNVSLGPEYVTRKMKEAGATYRRRGMGRW